jgi:hypothetical protein
MKTCEYKGRTHLASVVFGNVLKRKLEANQVSHTTTNISLTATYFNNHQNVHAPTTNNSHTTTNNHQNIHAPTTNYVNAPTTNFVNTTTTNTHQNANVHSAGNIGAMFNGGEQNNNK